jgi:molybdopterin-biosynthesis enzyme MoeA-like protein
MTDERQKMAILPKGADPLPNPVGAAPGVLLRLEKTIVACLPGVPEELKSVFGETMHRLWGTFFGRGVHWERAVVTDCGDESRLAPIVDRVAAGNSWVYVKSRAQPYTEGLQLRITLSLTSSDAEAAQAALDAAESDLTTRLRAADIAVVGRT